MVMIAIVMIMVVVEVMARVDTLNAHKTYDWFHFMDKATEADKGEIVCLVPCR